MGPDHRSRTEPRAPAVGTRRGHHGSALARVRPRRGPEHAPVVRIAAAVLYVFIGRTAATHRIFHDLETSSALTPGERLVIETFRSTLVQIDLAPSTAMEAADRVLDELRCPATTTSPTSWGSDSPPTSNTSRSTPRGARCSMTANRPHAGEVHRQSRSNKVTLASPSLLLRALGSAALVEACTGNLTLAESLGQRALGMVKDADLVAHPSTADGLLALAVVHYERGDLDQASHLLDEAGSRSRMNRRHTLLAIHALYVARISLAQGDSERALTALDTDPGDPPIPRGIAASRDAIRARVLAESGDTSAARTVLANADLLASPDVLAAAIHVELAQNDAAQANDLLRDWPDESEPRFAIERLVCAAMIADRSGESDDALQLMSEAVALGEPDGHVRAFVDSGRCAAALIRELAERQPSHYLREPQRTRAHDLRTAPLLERTRRTTQRSRNWWCSVTSRAAIRTRRSRRACTCRRTQ